MVYVTKEANTRPYRFSQMVLSWIKRWVTVCLWMGLWAVCVYHTELREYASLNFEWASAALWMRNQREKGEGGGYSLSNNSRNRLCSLRSDSSCGVCQETLQVLVTTHLEQKASPSPPQVALFSVLRHTLVLHCSDSLFIICETETGGPMTCYLPVSL